MTGRFREASQSTCGNVLVHIDCCWPTGFACDWQRPVTPTHLFWSSLPVTLGSRPCAGHATSCDSDGGSCISRIFCSHCPSLLLVSTEQAAPHSCSCSLTGRLLPGWQSQVSLYTELTCSWLFARRTWAVLAAQHISQNSLQLFRPTASLTRLVAQPLWFCSTDLQTSG